MNKIKAKIISISLVVSLIPLLATQVLVYMKTTVSVQNEFTEDLSKAASSKKAQIESYFSKRNKDAELLAENSMTKEALQSFTSAFKKGGLNDPSYKQAQKTFQSYYNKYVKDYKYYDLFLIDPNGNIVFTVAKESDLSTNLLNGPNKNTNLGKIFRKSLYDQTTSVGDYRYYKPSKEPAAFISTPILNQQKQVIGVLAFQLSDADITSIMNADLGLGKTSQMVLIGSDYKLRSNTPLVHKSTIGKQTIRTTPVQLAFGGEKGVGEFKSFLKHDVFSAYTPVNIKGLKWVILAETDKAEVMQLSKELLQYQLIIMGVVLLCVMGIAYLFGDRLSRPISRLAEASKTVAGGDLSSTVSVTSKDEVGSLSRSFNEMIQNLKDIIMGANDSALHLSSSSQQLSASCEESAKAAELVVKSSQNSVDGIQVQKAEINEMRKLLGDMTLGFRQMADDSKTMVRFSQYSNDAAQKGGMAIDNIVTQITDIGTSFHETNAIVQDLVESSTEIGTIISIINNIAEQTNLLSLNAAIEAARAGENGKGFAVVAEEIRKLANQSQASSNQIYELITKIQRETSRAMNSSKVGLENVEKGMVSSQEVKVAFGDITSSIQQLSDKVQQVSGSLERMNESGNKIVSSTERIDEMANRSLDMSQESMAASEEQLAAIQEITSAAQMLAGLSEKLQLMLIKFKL